MIAPEQIGWGGYGGYEGPYFHGTRKFQLPADPSANAKMVAVVTATEGGSANAINMYDRCILSVGYIQWCEADFLCSKLLGVIAERDLGLLTPLQPALVESAAIFTKMPRGVWRFSFKDARGEVDTSTEQKQLFLLNSSGLKGTWEADDGASKAHAKLWAASWANLLDQDEADAAHIDYTAGRIQSFAMPNAKAALFDDPTPSEGWAGALRAGFLSFAANNPAKAGEHLGIALKTAPGPKWSPDWCIHILKELTFGPEITIYPGRYGKIRPVMEQLYGVDLPDFAEDLQKWTDDVTGGDTPVEGEPTFMAVQEVQDFLVTLGYDLGPAGADGKMGPKTTTALRTFQGLQGLTADGLLGPKTRAALVEAWRAKNG